MQETKNVRGGETVHFDKLNPTKPLPTPNYEIKKPEKKEAHVPDSDLNKVPNKKSVFLVWLLSVVTLGIYPGVWYMKKVSEFSNLGTNKKLGNKLPTTFIIMNILLIAGFLIFPLTITETTDVFYQHLTTLQSGILLAVGVLLLLRIFFCLLLAFYSRSIINEALYNKGSKTKVSAFFTLIFTHLYLQYEINKIIDDKEDNPKIAPWVFLLIIFVLAVAGIVLPMAGIL